MLSVDPANDGCRGSSLGDFRCIPADHFRSDKADVQSAFSSVRRNLQAVVFLPIDLPLPDRLRPGDDLLDVCRLRCGPGYKNVDMSVEIRKVQLLRIDRV